MMSYEQMPKHNIQTVGQISVECIKIFLSKHISNWAKDMKFSPEVNNSQSNPHMQTNQKICIHKLCVNETGEKY